MKNETYTKLCMVGDFNYCTSCDEHCGYVYFVKICFEKETNEVVWINTKTVYGETILCPEDVNSWTPKEGARKQTRHRLNEFIVASEGPLYKLKDFCKGGVHEESILRNIVERNKGFEESGLPIVDKGVPEKILLPKRVIEGWESK